MNVIRYKTVTCGSEKYENINNTMRNTMKVSNTLMSNLGHVDTDRIRENKKKCITMEKCNVNNKYDTNYK